jgi:hypothetical protein
VWTLVRNLSVVYYTGLLGRPIEVNYNTFHIAGALIPPAKLMSHEVLRHSLLNISVQIKLGLLFFLWLFSYLLYVWWILSGVCLVTLTVNLYRRLFCPQDDRFCSMFEALLCAISSCSNFTEKPLSLVLFCSLILGRLGQIPPPCHWLHMTLWSVLTILESIVWWHAQHFTSPNLVSHI